MIKKGLSWLLFIVFSTLVIIGFSFKSNLNNYASQMMLKQISPELKQYGNQLIDSLYNHHKHKRAYQITFLEFGSTGCSACKKMEAVMDQVKIEYGDQIHVVFHNVSQATSLNLMKYYGIVSIPTQIFLDANGNEIYRHSGYISFNDIEEEVLIPMTKKTNYQLITDQFPYIWVESQLIEV